ncbi:hypothetical protein VTN49DRAFT_3799 [Thermomyces lanuginosus]|uniref:uncharacterized protein n=1 Tax=Thermomyces lanuginosus TaxID=5541 RepID=UPI003742ABC3
MRLLSFWIFPVISATMWLAMLTAMISSWAADGKPHYSSMEPGQRIAFISDIGASRLKPLFIAGSTVTVVFLDLAFLSERWLRHAGKLVPNKGRWDKACSVLSIIFAIAGAAGLILLSIFDTQRHGRLHNGFLAMFIAGYLVSSVFICLQYLRLGIAYRRVHRILFFSFWIKLIFILVELALAVAFGVYLRRGGRQNLAAVLEWVIAYIFTFYILSFAIDLFPAVRTRNTVSGEKEFIPAAAADPATSEAPPDRLSAVAAGQQQNDAYRQPGFFDSNTYRGQVSGRANDREYL